MSTTLGFAGCGNMAQAILCGILDNGLLAPDHIYIFDTDKNKTDKLKEEKSIRVCNDLKELQSAADILFLCVKPNIVPAVLAEITIPGKAIVSIAAGVTTAKIKNLLTVEARVLRIMPNTPLMVGKGAAGFEVPSTLTDDEFSFIKSIFEIMGIVVTVPGNMMDAVTGISGSGPAYVYYFLQAMISAGVRQGLSEQDSFALTLQTMKGALAMVEKTGKTPEKLKQEVCSPGGTTIEALAVFDALHFNETIDKAIDACVKKSAKLSE